MKRINILVATTMSMLILFTSSIYGLNITSNQEKLYLETLLPYNDEIVEFERENDFKECFIDSLLNVKIKETKKEVVLNLKYNDSTYDMFLFGDYEVVSKGNKESFAGVYEGLIAPINGLELELGDNGMLPVIADVVFNSNQAFINLTIGYAENNNKPLILSYGVFDENIQNIFTTYAQSNMRNNLFKMIDRSSYSTLVSNTMNSFKGSANIMLGSYNAGLLSVIHTNEIHNGSYSEVFIKVNTNTSSVKNYLVNELGYADNKVTVFADQITSTISGNCNELYSATTTISPKTGNTGPTISIPVYGGSIIGVQVIDVQLPIMSTSVSTGHFSPSSSEANNVTWKMSRTNGWPINQFEGSSSSKNALTVFSRFIYRGIVDGKTTASFTCKSSIRYLYWVITDNGSMVSYHITTKTASKTTLITILE